jgi:hypothetical protein
MIARRLAAISAILLLPLGACSSSFNTPANRANQATIAACRQRAEDVYVSQNRDLIYQNDTTSTPYSAGPNTGIPTHGLSSLYAHQQVVDDCVRNTGTETPRNDSAPVQPEGGGQGQSPPTGGLPP